MTVVIHKYQVTSAAGVPVPRGTRPIHAALQNDVVTVWVEKPVEDREEVTLYFQVVPTGFQQVDNGMWNYVGTVETAAGLIFHVYWHVTP